MVVVLPTPAPAPLPPPIIPTAITVPTPPIPQPIVLPKLPLDGIPVLAVQPVRPAPPQVQPAIHPANATAQSHPKPAAAASSSSYAPGPSVLPHPPYPDEARSLGETGIVVMSVQFDAHGNVTQADVAQSSGVPILDSATRSFIRKYWHSAAYAGQTVSQPVQYSLENL